jgi:C4-dicarboxylate-specific signal transduction histidine kinase
MQARDFDIELRLLTASGPKQVHIVAHRVDPARPVFLGAVQDVTETKRSEAALNTARADLARVSRLTALSALTASIAHEVNQPLAGIVTNASTCLRMLAADPPDLDGARATAQRTIRDGHRASDVIQRLRALFARRPPRMEPVDLNDAAREVLAVSSSDLQRRRVALRTDFAADLPAISGDRVQLQQVILNLVLNAADAMSEVEDRPRELLLATAQDAPGRVVLSVRDAGVGLAPHELERLFDAFYTTKAEGMGIGLSVSRSIIQGHDGRLWAAANEGPGATFAFAIPCGPERPLAPDGPNLARHSEPLLREA